MNDMQHEPGKVEEVASQEVDTDEGRDAPSEGGTTAEKAWSDDLEQEARTFGWKAPDEWQGEKPAGYIDDPQAYLERLEKFTPFRKQREFFEDRFRRLEAVQEKAMERLKAQYEAEKREIAAGKRRAVEEADTQAYDHWEQRERALQPPDAFNAQPQGPDPSVQRYVQENQWTQNPLLWKAAIEAVDMNPGIQTKPAGEQLAYAEQVVRQVYPHLFESKPKQPQRQMVDGGGLAGGQRKSEFDKLPSEAKQQFQKYVQQGLFTNDEAGKKEYVDAYLEG